MREVLGAELFHLVGDLGRPLVWVPLGPERSRATVSSPRHFDRAHRSCCSHSINSSARELGRERGASEADTPAVCARKRRSTGNPLQPKYNVDEGNGFYATTEGGGVLGFAIAFLAFAFGGALGLPPSVRLLVIGVGVLLAVLSARMRGFGLAALVLGGIVLVSSITPVRSPRRSA